MSQPLFSAKEIADLHQAYQDAIYEVYYCGRTIQLFIDRPNPELDMILEEFNCLTWTLITAYNPYSQCLSAAVNQQRHDSLIELVRSQNLTFFDGVGKDRDGVWTPEKSILIVGMELENAVALGKKFQQNAITSGKFGEIGQLVWL